MDHHDHTAVAASWYQGYMAQQAHACTAIDQHIVRLCPKTSGTPANCSFAGRDAGKHGLQMSVSKERRRLEMGNIKTVSLRHTRMPAIP
jgi:hypothetical protein